jgi:hypothetical protein
VLKLGAEFSVRHASIMPCVAAKETAERFLEHSDPDVRA